MKFKLFGLATIAIITITTQGAKAQVVDTEKPTITLIGDAVIQLIVGDTYIDEGASATDNIDGNLTGEIVVTNAVIDTDIIGTHLITYNVSDTAGNAADEMERTVTVNAQEIEILECVDAPPLGNNKGWDGEGNCHVNGEPWVPGISDQPGYQAGDTAIEEEDEPVILTNEPTITIQTQIIGGALTAQDLIFGRQGCSSRSVSTTTIPTGDSVIVDACYGENLPGGAFQPEGEFYLVDTPQDYDITISGTNCEQDTTYGTNVTYSVERGLDGDISVDAICTYTFTYVDPNPPMVNPVEPIVEEEPVDKVAEEEKEESVELITTTVEGDYTFVTTTPSAVEQGDVSTIEIEVTNNSGPEEFVFYTFLTKLPEGATDKDEGDWIFVDKFYADQTLAVGKTKTYSFPWLNNEESGSYKFFIEVKTVNWDKESLQKNGVATIEVNGANPQSLGQTLHRFYSEQYRGHFYTTSQEEKQNLIDNDPNWNYEGAGNKTVNKGALSPSNIQKLGITPVYRFWNDTYKHHFYTISESEKQATIANPDWAYENIAYYTYTTRQMDTTEVYRFYSPVYKGHFYTTSSEEKDAIIANDDNWLYEGIAWYAQR